VLWFLTLLFFSCLLSAIGNIYFRSSDTLHELQWYKIFRTQLWRNTDYLSPSWILFTVFYPSLNSTKLSKNCHYFMNYQCCHFSWFLHIYLRTRHHNLEDCNSPKWHPQISFFHFVTHISCSSLFLFLTKSMSAWYEVSHPMKLFCYWILKDYKTIA
jgi:hypothetical protein